MAARCLRWTCVPAIAPWRKHKGHLMSKPKLFLNRIIYRSRLDHMQTEWWITCGWPAGIETQIPSGSRSHSVTHTNTWLNSIPFNSIMLYWALGRAKICTIMITVIGKQLFKIIVCLLLSSLEAKTVTDITAHRDVPEFQLLNALCVRFSQLFLNLILKQHQTGLCCQSQRGWNKVACSPHDDVVEWGRRKSVQPALQPCAHVYVRVCVCVSIHAEAR